jgi:hypothetical protein
MYVKRAEKLTEGQIAKKLQRKFNDESITVGRVKGWVKQFKKRFLKFRALGPADPHRFFGQRPWSWRGISALSIT